MAIKKFLNCAAFVLLFATLAHSQTTTVNGTIVDPGGVIWANAIVTAQFQPAPNTPGPYTWSGGVLNPQPAPVVADGSGNFTITLPSNTAIVPSGSSWQFTVSPNATLPAAVVSALLSGGVLNLVSIINGASAWPTGNVPGSFVNKAYQTSQVGAVPLNVGALIYNTTLKELMFWNGLVWAPISGGGGGGSPPVGPGTMQFSNNVAGAFFSGGVINSDTVNTANNGITQAQSTLCTTTNCIITRPPSSTDTEASQPLAPVGGKVSSAVIDQIGNSLATLSMNPQGQNIVPINTFVGPQPQSQFSNVVTFSEVSPGTIQGNFQGQQINMVNNYAPGYSLGEGGSLFPQQPQYTGGASLWATPRGIWNVSNFNGSGIQNPFDVIVNCNATGDCGGAGSNFTNYAGGFLVFSDEGGKGMDNRLLSVPDWTGTISSVTDPYTLKATQIAKAFTQGQGRILVQSTAPIFSQINMTSILIPPLDGSNPPSITFAENLPISNFRGHNTADCVIPIQMGTVATIVSCDITIDSGTLVANTVPASSGAPNSNRWNHSMQVLCVNGLPAGCPAASPAPGHVIASFKANRSIVAGSFIFQGGLAGDAINMTADANFIFGGGNESRGSVFPIIGSELHKIYVVDYNASQVWRAPPDNGSQARTTATSGIAFGGWNLTNLVRTGGMVHATIASGNTAGQQFTLNGIRFFTVSGCSDATFNGVNSNTAFLDFSVDPNATTLSIPQPGQPDSTCAAAFLHVQTTVADILVAAEALDVENHTTATVDGTFVHSYQPGFTNGSAVFQPQSYSSAFLGTNSVVTTAVPSKQLQGLNVSLVGYAALGGDGITVSAAVIPQFVTGLGGFANTGSAVHVVGGFGTGVFQTDLRVDAAPPGGIVLSIGSVDNTCGIANPLSCPFFEQYDIVNGGSYAQHWNATTNVYSFCFPLCTTQLTNLNSNAFGVLSLSSGGIVSNAQHLFVNAQFEALKAGVPGPFGDYEPVVQFHNPNPLNHVSGVVSFDNVTAPPIFVSSTLPAGGTQYNYLYVIHTPYGDSISSVNFIFSLAASFGGGTITMSCSNIGAGNTADLYRFINPDLFQVTNGTGHCASTAGNVVDDGTSYGSSHPADGWSAGAPLFTGSVINQGFRGIVGFTTSNNFDPLGTITASINQHAAGVLSLNTTATDNGLGSLILQNITINGTCSGTGCTTGTPITLSTTGTSGAATLIGSALNIPIYGAGPANTTIVLPTSSIGANACTAPSTATLTGTATSSTFTLAYATDPAGVTGWGSTGGLVFNAWPTLNTVNWEVCNQTTSPITPGALTLNVGLK